MHDNGRYVNLEFDTSRRLLFPARDAGPKKFAEPVSVSSTVFADLSLAGSAFELGFDLLRFRARRKRESRTRASPNQGAEKAWRPQFAEIQFSTFPQQGVQLVEKPLRHSRDRVTPVPHLRMPAFSHGVWSFVWALVFGLYVWLGGLAIGVAGGTAFIFGAVVAFLVYLLVMAYGSDEPQRQPRRAGRR